MAVMVSGTLTIALSSVTAVCLNQSRHVTQFDPLPVFNPDEFANSTACEKYADSAVLEAVLLNLLNSADSPVELGKNDDKEIHFSPFPLRSEVGFNILLLQFEQNTDNPKPQNELRALHEAVRHFDYRVKTKDFFCAFTPYDSRVIIDPDMDRLGNVIGGPYQIFSAHSPGYSEDGIFAVVHLRYMWAGNYHSAEASYFMQRVEGFWIVVERNIMHHF
jgi:hypothetical protein